MIDYIKKNYLNILFGLLIYISNDTILFGMNRNNTFVLFQYIFLVILLIIFFMYNLKHKKIEGGIFYISCFLIFIAISTMIIKDSLSLKYFYELILIIIALFIVNVISFKNSIKAYINAMYFFVILSFIPFLINIFIPEIINYFPVVNGKLCNFHNLFVGFVPFKEYLFNTYRNYSFFREPGMYGVFINFALLLLILLKDDNKFLKKMSIFIMGSISTLSTGAVLNTFIIMMFYIIKEKISFKKIIIAFMFFIGIIGILLSNYMNNALFGKLRSNNGSYYSRLSSVFSNIKIGINNPVLGVGWENIQEDFKVVSANAYGNPISHGEPAYHNTNSILKLVAMHGFIYIAIYIYGLYLFLFKITKNKKFAFLSLLISFIILSNEDLTLNILLILFVMYGYKKVEGGNIDEDN